MARELGHRTVAHADGEPFQFEFEFDFEFEFEFGSSLSSASSQGELTVATETAHPFVCGTAKHVARGRL
jgi:hypothetical protein